MSGNQDYSVDVKIEDENLHIYITKIQEAPEQGPDAEDLEAIFAGQIRVTCVNNGHKFITYSPSDVSGGVTTGSASQADGVWTCTATVHYAPFVEQYSNDIVSGSDVEEHTLRNSSVTEKPVKLVWTEETGWTAAADQLPVVIETVCTNPQVDAIQVVMSDGVQDLYDNMAGVLPWIRTNFKENQGGMPYYEMGPNGWIQDIYGISVNEISRVTMGRTPGLDGGGEQLAFYMDADNGNLAKITYWYEYQEGVLKDYYTLVLYCQLVEERDPEEPGDEELEGEDTDDADGLLADKIKVDCTTDDSHADAAYGLVKDCYERPEGPVYNSATNQWEYTITVKAQSYADHYATAKGYEDHTASSEDKTVTLVHDGDQWTYPGEGVTIQVTCEQGTQPGDEKPLPPTAEEITDPEGILENAIQLDCSTDGHAPEAYSIAENGEDVTSYEVGEVKGTAETGYTCVITVYPLASYLEKYDETYESVAGHTYDPEDQSDTITLVWDADDGQGAWDVKDGKRATFAVRCEPTVVGSYDLTFDANGGKFYPSENPLGQETY